MDKRSETVLQVKELSKLYPVKRSVLGALLRKPVRHVHAVDGVSFSARRGEILGLVGESGSGKTTTAMCVLGLVEPSRGEVLFDGEPVAALAKGKQRLALRRRMQMIFQDPYESLNPRQTVFQIIAEPLEIHRLSSSREETERRVAAALEDAGLAPAESYLERYPEELSGGQRQRIVIANALVLNPELLVADEPVSMLDVSIRAGILNLLRELRDQHNITILYITHDLGTTSYLTDRLAVMYLGQIVEIGPTEQVLKTALHPYTRALISVIPAPNPRRRRERVILSGEIPNPIDVPTGCRFHPRCPAVMPSCKLVAPQLKEVAEGHQAACLLYE